MRELLGLLLLITAAPTQPLFPDAQTDRGTSAAVVYLAEAGGGVLGTCIGALPGVGVFLIAYESEDFGDDLLAVFLALAGMPFGAAEGVRLVGDQLGADGTFGSALLGAVVGGAAACGLLAVANDDMPWAGIAAVPVGAVVGYNLFRRRSQREFGLGAGRLGLPALESYAAITESGSIVPGVRAQVLTVRF